MTLDEVLKGMEEKIQASQFHSLSGVRLERDVALPFITEDVPRLISALRKAIEQRNSYRFGALTAVENVSDAYTDREVVRTEAEQNAELASTLKGEG